MINQLLSEGIIQEENNPVLMNMVQTQPLQTTDFYCFLGKLLKNKRTEKIYDLKSL